MPEKPPHYEEDNQWIAEQIFHHRKKMLPERVKFQAGQVEIEDKALFRNQSSSSPLIESAVI